MTEYIDKQKLIEWLREQEKAAAETFGKVGGESGVFAEAFHGIADELSAFPAADVAPVVHGRWALVGADKRGRGGVWHCSACGKRQPHKGNCCPSCGARMDGDA